jgi:predicted dehydrogenase
VSNDLKAAVIGLGVGTRHITSYNEHPHCNVDIVCDFEQNALDKISEKMPSLRTTKYADEVINDPNVNILSIASYDHYHAEQVVNALEQGKHVFVEKPLCMNRKELDLIISTLNKYPQLNLSSNLILRQSPRFIELKKRIEKGLLGETYHFEGSYDYGRLSKLTEGWRGSVPNYSVTHGGAIHLIDLILWLSGKKAISAQAVGNKIPTQNSQFKGFSLTSAIIEFEDGSTAQITSNFASLTPHHHKLCVYGTSGTFEQSHLGAAYFHRREPEQPPEIVHTPYPGTPKGALLYDFIESILGDKEPLPSKREVLETMAVSLAIDESIKTHAKESIAYPSLQ